MRPRQLAVCLTAAALSAAAAAAPAQVGHSAVAAPCAPAGCERWSVHVEGEGAARAEASALSPDRRRLAIGGRADVAVAGPRPPLQRPAHRLAALLAGVDASAGARLWQTFHRHPFMTQSGVDGFEDVVFSADGRSIYAAGTFGKSGDAPDSDVLVAAYEAETGAERWSRAIDGPAHQRDVGTAVAVAADGGTVLAVGSVCARLTDRCEDWDWLIAGLDPNGGSVRWSVQHDGGEANDEPREVEITPDGRTALVTGVTGTGCASVGVAGATAAAPGDCDTDTTTIALDVDTGARRWIVVQDPPEAASDQPTALAIAPGGGSAVVASNSTTFGSGGSPGTVEATITALDTASGRVLWRSSDAGAFAADVAFLAGGREVVAATTRQLDIVSVVYAAGDGRRRAEARYDGPVQGEDGAYAVTAAPSGGFAVLGSVRAGPALTDFDAAVVAYDGQVREAWRTVIPAIRRPADVHVLHGGTAVAAVGTSEDLDGPDAVAVALEAGSAFKPRPACRPRARIAPRSQLGRRRLVLRGSASGVACPGGVAAVDVALALRAGARCRHLGPNGRLGPRRSCSARRWLRARGTRRWTLRKAGRFPRGRYVAAARAVTASSAGPAGTRRLRVR